VNYDVPTDAESYVHRIGRTARAGKSGKAITLACEKFVYGLPAIEKLTGQKIPVSWADEDLMEEDKSAGMRFHFDKRAGAPGEYQGSRDGHSRSGGSRGGVSRKYSGGNKRPLDARAARVQSAVLAVSGTMDAVEDDIKKTDSRRDSAVRDQSRKRKSGYKGQKPTDNRSRNRGDNKAPASVPMERVSSKNSIEDRLAYYKAKYGEDFQSDGVSSKESKGGSRSGGNRNRNSSRKSGPQRQGQAAGGQAGRRPASTEPRKTAPQVQPAAAPKAPEKKKGLLARLFGKK